MTLAFVGIVIAIALGVVALLKPAAQAAAPVEVAPQYSEQQVAEAKKAVCGARDKAFGALKGAAKQKSDDPNLQMTLVVNTRLAEFISSSYLINTLDKNPATKLDLAKTIRDVATAYDDIVLAQLANASDSDLAPLNASLDSADAKVVEACK
jgi:hypothetical protein